MSRYTKKLQENKEIAYGYDRAMGYFYDIFDNTPGIDDENSHLEGADSLFGYSKGPKIGKKFSNAEMGEVLTKHKVNTNHIQAVALDIKF
jgi:hypothetical protein